MWLVLNCGASCAGGDWLTLWLWGSSAAGCTWAQRSPAEPRRRPRTWSSPGSHTAPRRSRSGWTETWSTLWDPARTSSQTSQRQTAPGEHDWPHLERRAKRNQRTRLRMDELCKNIPILCIVNLVGLWDCRTGGGALLLWSGCWGRRGTSRASKILWFSRTQDTSSWRTGSSDGPSGLTHKQPGSGHHTPQGIEPVSFTCVQQTH